MEAKHTKGVWEFRKWDGDQWPEKRWSVGVKEANGKAICISPRYDFETEESEANAQLIAEAGTVANETGLKPREMQQLSIEALVACLMCFQRNNTGGFNGFGKRWDEGSPYEKAYLLYQKLNPISKTQTTQP
jgi:hypothetical protein